MSPLLEQTAQGLLAEVDPRLKKPIAKVVMAGRKLLYSESTVHFTSERLKMGVAPDNIGAGVAQLAGLIYVESKKTIPPEILVPATNLLMVEVLELIEELGLQQVNADYLAQCTQETNSAFMQMMGISQKQIDQIIAQQGGQMPQPGQMGQPQQPPMQKSVIAGAIGGAP